MTIYLLTEVKGYGWLCRIEIDGVEQYRGSFEPDAYTAMDKAFEWEDRRRADALDAFGDMLQGKILKCNCGLCEQCVYPSEAP